MSGAREAFDRLAVEKMAVLGLHPRGDVMDARDCYARAFGAGDFRDEPGGRKELIICVTASDIELTQEKMESLAERRTQVAAATYHNALEAERN